MTYRTLSGRSIAEIIRRYGEERAFPALGKQLYREAIGIMAQSVPLVPKDTGALSNSGYVEEPKRQGLKISVTFGYGGVAAKINPKTGESTAGYALEVHENLEAFHKVGMAQYLSIPFYQATRGMADRIAFNARADLNGSAGMAAPPEGEA